MGNEQTYTIEGCTGCCTGAVPCTDCDPGGTGTAPSGVSVTIDSACLPFGGAADPFDDNVNPIPYKSFNSSTNYCKWEWFTGIDNQIVVHLYFIKNDSTTITAPDLLGGGTCSNITGDEGEWVLYFATNYFQGNTDEGEWFEKTTGFSCSTGTGKVSGTHVFGGPCFSQNDCSGLTPTLTVAA